MDNVTDARVMEPQLVVFEEEQEPSQMFIVAEGEEIFELSATQLSLMDGVTLLMATYYIFDIQYPSAFKSTQYFFQDILMDRKDKNKSTKARPTRYSLYLTSLGF